MDFRVEIVTLRQLRSVAVAVGSVVTVAAAGWWYLAPHVAGQNLRVQRNPVSAQAGPHTFGPIYIVPPDSTGVVIAPEAGSWTPVSQQVIWITRPEATALPAAQAGGWRVQVTPT